MPTDQQRASLYRSYNSTKGANKGASFWPKIEGQARVQLIAFQERMTKAEYVDYIALIKALRDKKGVDDNKNLADWTVLERENVKFKLSALVLKALYLDATGIFDKDVLANNDVNALAALVATQIRALHKLGPIVLQSQIVDIGAHHPWNALIFHTLKSEAGHFPTYYNSLHTKQDMTKDAPYAGDVRATYDAYHKFMGRPRVPAVPVIAKESVDIAQLMEDRLVGYVPQRPPLKTAIGSHCGSRGKHYHRSGSSGSPSSSDDESSGSEGNINYYSSQSRIAAEEDEFSAMGLPTVAQVKAMMAKNKK